ncbi:hypothetical protein ANCCEY_04320 [Ancylostoma ceylanicum]|uniref:Uncharacterized protein n=1 Tax=Ancylostoma ceylanicum TaxID=53326 RepID=A0A0D6M2Q9_9BILA|nr:hypothetical protein ANCCEY_04320 [Ancylostoma ceylanicum]
MNLRTFGAQAPMKIQCIRTFLNVWDADGVQQPHLYTQNNLTKDFSEGELDDKDLQFIRQHQIHMSAHSAGTINSTQILIGCDQPWSFVKFEVAQFRLPSGLMLVPTRLGYMVSGQRFLRNNSSALQLYSSVHTIESCEDLDPWGLRWKTEFHEMEKEYTEPEKRRKKRSMPMYLMSSTGLSERESMGTLCDSL